MKKKTENKKNILDDLFNKDIENKPAHGFEELSVLVYRGSQKGIEQSPEPEDKNVTPQKTKISYSASDRVSIELKDTAAKIKVMLPPKMKKKISMEKIVDYAVKAILEELKNSE